MKPSPFSAMNIDMPLWRGCASGSVLVSSSTMSPYMELVIQVLAPLIT